MRWLKSHELCVICLAVTLDADAADESVFAVAGAGAGTLAQSVHWLSCPKSTVALDFQLPLSVASFELKLTLSGAPLQRHGQQSFRHTWNFFTPLEFMLC